MTDRKHLTNELIAKIADGIKAMPPKPASRKEIEQLLGGIEAQVRDAQERGCTYAQIAKQITENGYPIKTSTLRIAIQRRRTTTTSPKTKARTTSRTPRQASAHPPSSATAHPTTPPVIKGTQQSEAHS
jgi:hypothetical protein